MARVRDCAEKSVFEVELLDESLRADLAHPVPVSEDEMDRVMTVLGKEEFSFEGLVGRETVGLEEAVEGDVGGDGELEDIFEVVVPHPFFVFIVGEPVGHPAIEEVGGREESHLTEANESEVVFDEFFEEGEGLSAHEGALFVDGPFVVLEFLLRPVSDSEGGDEEELFYLVGVLKGVVRGDVAAEGVSDEGELFELMVSDELVELGSEPVDYLLSVSESEFLARAESHSWEI